MLKLKLQYFGHLRRADSLEKSRLTGKDPDAGKGWGQEEKGTAEDEMIIWRLWLNGHEFEQTPGDGGAWHTALWSCKELDNSNNIPYLLPFGGIWDIWTCSVASLPLLERVLNRKWCRCGINCERSSFLAAPKLCVFFLTWYSPWVNDWTSL